MDRYGVYALDATELTVYGNYQGMGRRKIVEEIITKEGKIKRRVKKEKGYKLVSLMKVTPKKPYLVVASLIPLNQHESTVAFPLIQKALKILPPKSLKLLLLDRAFLDGDFFKKLKIAKIDFIVPTKERMDITEDMRQLLSLRRKGEKAGILAKAKDGTELIGFSSLKSLSSYPYALRGVLISSLPKKKREIKEGEEFGYLTSLPLSREKQVIKVYERYLYRWMIENTGFKELKEGWHLGRFPGRSLKAVTAHIYLILFMFNAFHAYKSDKGKTLTAKGIRALRNRYFNPKDEVILFIDDYFGIFSFKEFLNLMNLPPPGKLKGKETLLIFPNGRKIPFRF